MPTETHLVVLDHLLGPTLGPRFLCLFEPILRSFLRADAADDESLKLLAAKLVQCASDISGLHFFLWHNSFLYFF